MTTLNIFGTQKFVSDLLKSNVVRLSASDLNLGPLKIGELVIITEQIERMNTGSDVFSITYLDGETHLHDAERCGAERHWPENSPPIWTSRLTLKVKEVRADLIEFAVLRCNFDDLTDLDEGGFTPPVLVSVAVH